MNGKNMLTGLSYIDRKFIEESETESASAKAGAGMKPVIRKPFLIAAIIALMVFFMGCAVVYMLSMKGIHIGQQ